MQKSQSQQRLDRQQCMTGQACQENNRTILITAHHNFSWQWSGKKQFYSRIVLSFCFFRAADVSQNPLENHSALQLSLLLLSSTLPPFSSKESHWVKSCSFPLTSPSAPQQLQMVSPTRETEQGLESGSKQEGQGWKSPGGLRGDARILSWCHCCCTRKIIFLFLTLSLFIDFSVSKSREMFTIKASLAAKPCVF